MIVFWNENTPQIHLWIDIVPQGFGMARSVLSVLLVDLRLKTGLVQSSLITTTLIVSDMFTLCYERG